MQAGVRGRDVLRRWQVAKRGDATPRIAVAGDACALCGGDEGTAVTSHVFLPAAWQMSRKGSLMKIDFNELEPESLEFLTADLLREEGFAIESAPGRGPDHGKDLMAVRHVPDDIGVVQEYRLLVECKHLSKSGKSVREADIGNFEAKMKQHRATHYLLVTTTIASETVKNQLEAVSNDTSSPRKATYWGKDELTGRIQKYQDVLEKYFRSWQREAAEAVDYVHSHLHEAHRGAILWCPGVTAIFGNDNHKDERSRAGLQRLQDKLVESEMLANHTDGYSWVVLVRSDETMSLFNLVWDCCSVKDHPAYSHQLNEAHAKVWSYFRTPHKKD